MRFYVKIKDDKRAEALWRVMQQVQIQANEETYSILMSLHINTNETNALIALWEEMKVAGIKCHEVTDVILQSDADLIDTNAIRDCIEKFPDTLDMSTCYILMLLYVKNADLNGAKGLLKKMAQAYITPDELIYKLMIDLLVGLDLLDEAEALFKKHFAVESRLKDCEFDVRDLSQGSAYIALKIFIKSVWDEKPFKVLFGYNRGNDCEDGSLIFEEGSMKGNYLQGKLAGQFKHLDCRVNENAGIMHIEPKA